MALYRLTSGLVALLLALCIPLVAGECSSLTLANTSHLTYIGTYPRTKTPQQNSAPYCKMASSCCSDAVLSEMRGEYVLNDYLYSTMEFLEEKLRKNPSDFSSLMLSGLRKSMHDVPGINLTDFTRAMGVVSTNFNAMALKVKPIQNAGFTLWSSYLTYVTGLTCTLCMEDTSQFLSVTANRAELKLNNDICDDVANNFIKYIEAMGTFFNDEAVFEELANVAVEICKMGTQEPCTPDMIKMGMKVALGYLSSDSMKRMICGGPGNCREFICVDTLTGLGISVDHLRGNLLAFLDDNCAAEPCRSSIYPDASTFINDLTTRHVMSDGYLVRNSYVATGGLDLKALGCGSGLTEYACRTADIDGDTTNGGNPTPASKSGGSGVGTFFLVLLILGLLGGGGYYVYMKKKENGELPINLYSSLG